MTYDKGDKARLTVVFRDLAGALADPTAVIITVKLPHADPVSYSSLLSPAIVMRESIGRYHLDLDLGTSGTWKFKWTGLGDLIAAEEGWLFVRPSDVG